MALEMEQESASDLHYLLKLHKDHPLQSPPSSGIEVKHECPSCQQFKLKMMELERRIQALEGKRKEQSNAKVNKGYESEEEQEESLLQPDPDYGVVTKQLFPLPKTTAAKTNHQKHHQHFNKQNSNQISNRYASQFADQYSKQKNESDKQIYLDKQIQVHEKQNPSSIFYQIEILKQHLLETYPQIKIQELDWEKDPLLISPFKQRQCPQPYPHLQNQNTELRKRMLRYRRQLQYALKQIRTIKSKIIDCSCPCIQYQSDQWVST